MTETLLTVRNPWARAMFAPRESLRKTIENRTWGTDHRGRLGIHVGRRPDPLGYDFVTDLDPAQDLRDRGHVIGFVNVVDAHPAGSDRCAEHGCYGNPFAFWTPPDEGTVRRRAMWHWILRNPREFITPIPATGHLQLWVAEPSLAGKMGIAEVKP